MRWKELAAACALAAIVSYGAGITLVAAADDKIATSQNDEEEKGFFGKLKDDIVEGAESVKQEAAAAVPDVPQGAVVAFNRDECPAGWSAFPPADGRVIIGTNDGSTGRKIVRNEIGEMEKADTASRNADEGDYVNAGLPWLGLLYCEKD